MNCSGSQRIVKQNFSHLHTTTEWENANPLDQRPPKKEDYRTARHDGDDPCDASSRLKLIDGWIGWTLGEVHYGFSFVSCGRISYIRGTFLL